MIEHYFDELGFPTASAKFWYFDVCHGRYALLDDQREVFDKLREAMAEDRFYETAAEAFVTEFPRIQTLFQHMIDENGDEE